MEAGTMRKLLDYYYENPKFELEIEMALVEFFGKNENLENLESKYAKDSRVFELFDEWLAFDFKLENKKTLLEDFYERNPYNLPIFRMQVYKDLQENKYSFYEVLRVDLGQGLLLLNLKSGEEVYVNEISATYESKKGFLFFGRQGKVGDKIELVGSNPVSYGDLLKLGRGAREYFLQSKEKYSPKMTKDLLLENLGYKERKGLQETAIEKVMSIEDAKKELDLLLKKVGIESFVSADNVEGWIDGVKWDKDEVALSPIISILVGLSDGKLLKCYNELAELIKSIYVNTPQKYLGDKTPLEKQKEQKSKKRKSRPKLMYSATNIGDNKWYELQVKARELMYLGKHEKANEKYLECFRLLLKDRTTSSQIYRVFGNYAINQMYLGNEEMGVEFLRIALELNPKYDFAIKEMERYEKGEYESTILRARIGSLKKIKDFLKGGRQTSLNTILSKNLAYIYYQFLKQFKINFETDKLTKSKITKKRF